jgi:hypothetical protein
MLKYELSMFDCLTECIPYHIIATRVLAFLYQLIKPATNGVKGTAGNPIPFCTIMGGGGIPYNYLSSRWEENLFYR